MPANGEPTLADSPTNTTSQANANPSPTPSAGPWTAAVGAAGGEGFRKSIAGGVLDEPQTPTGNIKAMGKEAAMAYVGDIAGRGITRGINRLGALRGGRVASHAGRGRQLIDIKKFSYDFYIKINQQFTYL